MCATMTDRFSKKFEEIFSEIKVQKETPKQPLKDVISFSIEESELKKEELSETEKKAYFELSLHYKLTIMAIKNLSHAIKVWLGSILPILLEKHSITREEWDRIGSIGDNNQKLEKELEQKWKLFFENEVKKKLINSEIWNVIQKYHDL